MADMESQKDTWLWNQKSWFFIQSGIQITYLGSLVMIHGDGIIWMAIQLCWNPISSNNTV